MGLFQDLPDKEAAYQQRLQTAMQYRICRTRIEASASILFENFAKDIEVKVAIFNSKIQEKRMAIDIDRTTNGLILLKNDPPRHKVELYFENSRPSIRVFHTVNLRPMEEPKHETQDFTYTVGEYDNAVWITAENGKRSSFSEAADLVLDRLAAYYPSSRQ